LAGRLCDKGNNTPEREKSGALVFLAPKRKSELGWISLANLGIFRLARGPWKPDAEAIRRVMAELYCEQVWLAFASSDLS
jgi:hypothetical protein